MADHSSGRDSEESDRSLKSNMIPEHQFLLDEASEQNFGKRASPFLWAWRFTITILALGWVAPLVTHSHHQGDVFDSSNPWPKPRLSPLPDDVFQTVKKTFYPEESYIGPSNETHRNWDELVAAHDALYIAEPETYGLPEGIPPPFDHPNKINDGPHNFYVIAGLHQMHCLNIIRFHYFQVETGFPQYRHYSKEAWEAHMEHCFEYLRLSISCGSPFTVEGSSPLADPGGHGLIASTVTGWGVEHDCINYEAMRTFQINQEKLYNRTWQ